METILIQFIATLEAQLKTVQARAGDAAGFNQLTINQLRYVDAIAELGEPSISEVAEKLDITRASVTMGINKLVELGYVTKIQSSADKRVFHVRLTETSQKLVESRNQALKEYGEFIRASLTADEARQLETTLAKLSRLFHQE